ncbi:hypothetical protein PENTCL1PPCAC_29910, partial [Pristionchus entomophagus]
MSALIDTETMSPSSSPCISRNPSSAKFIQETFANALEEIDEKTGKFPSDMIFDLLRHSRDKASITQLLKLIRQYGINISDPRLKPMMDRIASHEQFYGDDLLSSSTFELKEGIIMDRNTFKHCIRPCLPLVLEILRGNLVVPEWQRFTSKMTELFEECRNIKDGQVASYIPQLARADPNLWGMSICSVDGQRFHYGDSKADFCIQSLSKAFNYAIVATDIGADKLHGYVGHEPSGRLFNEICLDAQGKPHNPMINSGAIVVSSLIRLARPLSDRFDFIISEYRKLSGGLHVGFNNATFLSERDTADRNYAISHFMKEYDCFPPGIASLREELDLYFQLCSLECCCETLSVMAATLANGGINPLTQKRAISAQACRDVLSLMYSCGMYDLSGKFAFQVGLPAKSGVSGGMIVVVPNVMGMCLYSPPLDKTGNSTRGVAFCMSMVKAFNFHNYDSLVHTDSRKIDPRRRLESSEAEQDTILLLYSAKNANMDRVRKLYAKGVDMNGCDYDGRTALHLAAAEGHNRIVRFLLRTARVDHTVRDRWGRTPCMEAESFGNHITLKIMKKHEDIEIGEVLPMVEGEPDLDSEEEEFAYMRTSRIRRAKREMELKAREEQRAKALERKIREQRRKRGEIVTSSEDSEREDEDEGEKREEREVMRG